MTRALRSAALLAAVVAMIGSGALVDRAWLPSPSARRFSGAFRSASDLLWVKIAGRVAFVTRVSAQEAEENYRLTKVAARLNPEAREPYRYGALGLMIWDRSDLALKLAEEGLRRFPGDTELNRSLVTILFLADVKIDSRAYARVLDEASDPSRPFAEILWTLRAKKLEEWGRTEEALAAWRKKAELFAGDAFITAQAAKEIRRLESRGASRGTPARAGNGVQ